MLVGFIEYNSNKSKSWISIIFTKEDWFKGNVRRLRILSLKWGKKSIKRGVEIFLDKAIYPDRCQYEAVEDDVF